MENKTKKARFKITEQIMETANRLMVYEHFCEKCDNAIMEYCEQNNYDYDDFFNATLEKLEQRILQGKY